MLELEILDAHSLLRHKVLLIDGIYGIASAKVGFDLLFFADIGNEDSAFVTVCRRHCVKTVTEVTRNFNLIFHCVELSERFEGIICTVRLVSHRVEQTAVDTDADTRVVVAHHRHLGCVHCHHHRRNVSGRLGRSAGLARAVGIPLIEVDLNIGESRLGEQSFCIHLNSCGESDVHIAMVREEIKGQIIALYTVEEFEEEFGVVDGALFPMSDLVRLLVFFRLLHISEVKTRACVATDLMLSPKHSRRCFEATA